MVRAGELGGVLEVVLTRLAEFQEKAQKIKNKVVAAMVYPIIVLVLALAIMTFLMVFIVPRFEAIFHDMLGDKPLPAITLFVIGVSGFVQNHWAILLGFLVGMIVLYKVIARTRAGRALFDRIKLRAPLFGDLIRKTSISRFSRTLGTLVTSGVPILQALTITRETAGNMRHRPRDLAGARQRKRRGIDRAAAGSERRFSANGHQHDRCRGRDRPVARDAAEDRGGV